MKKYIAPKTEVQPLAMQSIMQSSGSGSSTPSPTIGGNVPQGGMEAKQTTTFTFE